MLGDALGISFQQVQKCEKGANRIGGSRLYEMSNVLDVPISFFFDGMPADIADQPGYEAEDLGTFESQDAIELINAYTKISNQNVRKSLKDVAKALGGSKNGNDH